MSKNGPHVQKTASFKPAVLGTRGPRAKSARVVRDVRAIQSMALESATCPVYSPEAAMDAGNAGQPKQVYKQILWHGVGLGVVRSFRLSQDNAVVPLLMSLLFSPCVRSGWVLVFMSIRLDHLSYPNRP